VTSESSQANKDGKWTKESFSVESERRQAAKDIKEGTFGIKQWVTSLMTPFFGGVQVWRYNDNKVLGVGEVGSVDLGDVVRRVAKDLTNKA
jgi:hypothetical protein